MEKEEGEWHEYQSMNVLLMAGQTRSYRCYLDIPVEIADLEDDFTVSITLPSSGQSETFSYAVTAEGRKAAAEREAAQKNADLQAAKDAEAAELAEIDSNLAKEIEQQLTGEWEFQEDKVTYTLSFENGACRVDSAINGTPALSNEGTYSIREKAVLIQYNNGKAVKLSYTYENGELTMYPPLTPVVDG